MDSANKLIGALGGEYTRWKADSAAFDDEIRRMAGDVALACAFVCYAGPFNADFRTLLLRERFEAAAHQEGARRERAREGVCAASAGEGAEAAETIDAVRL